MDDLSPNLALDGDADLGRRRHRFPPPAVQPQPASISPIAAAAGFVFMMAVGAAGAALVFHDRLALLLR